MSIELADVPLNAMSIEQLTLQADDADSELNAYVLGLEVKYGRDKHGALPTRGWGKGPWLTNQEEEVLDRLLTVYAHWSVELKWHAKQKGIGLPESVRKRHG